MILLQDEFAQVISRMEKKMKDVMVLSTRQGAPLTDLQQRQILANIDVNIKFMHTTADDAVGLLSLNNSTPEDRFPFIWINSDTVRYGDDGNVDIGEMYLAALSKGEFNVNERDAYNLRPILCIMSDILIEALKFQFATEYPLSQSTSVVYKGEMDNTFKDFTDCFKFTNTKLRILTT